ncbi:hypothetical protein LTR56_022809 [Elasticomyces elasticus]|nr:hypothetical protein LTR56_022809 [Elasticomyces elasticus]KAK3627535.1 hypothetical protein LTR22_022723 [Elasticomyces elasticus]KAK4907643.1 hypothetical protein LTR49_023343 [Elasticomyces elasticus]KAK5747814.1 hypothetical protein LTS12_022120 [Elasticomyces elasticus]
MAQSSKITGNADSGPLWFWREFEEPYGYLSQWYECPFEVDGVTYLTAEMWMMIEKAKLFGDEETAQKMMETTVPAEHQALGRKAKGFDRKKWDQRESAIIHDRIETLLLIPALSDKSRIVEEGNYHKFTKSKTKPEMLGMLMATGDRELVEASPTDRIWGVGFGAATAEENRADWGENRLGKAIMAVRDRLKQEGHQ